MDERRSNPPPQVTAVAITDHGCEVTVADSVAGVPGPIPTTNGTVEWVAYGCFHASGVRGATVAVGQTFRRWSRLVFLNSTSVIVDLRSSVGSATDITQLRYNFTAREPNYFDRAHREYNDYLGRRIVNGSRFGEPNFVETSRYLAPAQEYAMIGTNNASVKWIVCPDGVVKRSDQALLEPVLDASPARCEFGDPAAGYEVCCPLRGLDSSDRVFPCVDTISVGIPTTHGLDTAESMMLVMPAALWAKLVEALPSSPTAPTHTPCGRPGRYRWGRQLT